MNLKEAFRYQNFLAALLTNARTAMSVQDNLLEETRTHWRKKANPNGVDETETVEQTDLEDPNKCVDLAVRVIQERETLARAIDQAKTHLTGDVGDMDAAIEANKARQAVAQQIRSMLRAKAAKRVERGTAYAFNAEGNQMPYYYDIEVVTKERFDRAAMKTRMGQLLTEADKVSAQIDEAVVNTPVDYLPPWDVNASFEDILAQM
ncbi:hypothetical protein [uncultured Flavonifractor sp.]|uniref:hypothetical protein n=1 Tax=uncultured Flavonifractor sp. TaxID=1193534 RepID=UPI002593501A|nr:hypothetical protein [uncultured Flavonifractor sp.]